MTCGNLLNKVFVIRQEGEKISNLSVFNRAAKFDFCKYLDWEKYYLPFTNMLSNKMSVRQASVCYATFDDCVDSTLTIYFS